MMTRTPNEEADRAVAQRIDRFSLIRKQIVPAESWVPTLRDYRWFKKAAHLRDWQGATYIFEQAGLLFQVARFCEMSSLCAQLVLVRETADDARRDARSNVEQL